MINISSVVYRWGVNPLIIENRYDGILSRLLLLSHTAAAFQFERPQTMTILMASSYSSCYFIIILGGIAIKNKQYCVFTMLFPWNVFSLNQTLTICVGENIHISLYIVTLNEAKILVKLMSFTLTKISMWHYLFIFED